VRCGILVGVKDKKIVKVKGDPDGFLNKGYICAKGLVSPDRLTHPDRLTYPLKRLGNRGDGRWTRISWSEALEYTAEKLNTIKDKYGAKGVCFIASQDVCHAPREITGIHTCGFYPVADLHHKSKLILLWASNITSTNEEGEINSMLLEQIEDGTELVIIDPRKIDLAKKAKTSIQLRPGTDHALALGFLHVIIKEALYDKEFVEKWTYGFDELASQYMKPQGYMPHQSLLLFSGETLLSITFTPLMRLGRLSV